MSAARIVPISGPGIDDLIAREIPYTSVIIPAKQLCPGAADQTNVATLGVLATLCTSAEVSERVVYNLTKEVFDNFDYFREQRPAFRDRNKKDMLEGLSAPLHPGAIKYFMESGLLR